MRLGVVCYFHTNRCTGQEKFLASSSVFNMNGLHDAVYIYMGNKTVWTVYEDPVRNFSVFQMSYSIFN